MKLPYTVGVNRGPITNFCLGALHEVNPTVVSVGLSELCFLKSPVASRSSDDQGTLY